MDVFRSNQKKGKLNTKFIPKLTRNSGVNKNLPTSKYLQTLLHASGLQGKQLGEDGGVRLDLVLLVAAGGRSAGRGLTVMLESEWVLLWLVFSFLGRGGGVLGTPGYSRVQSSASYPGRVDLELSIDLRRS